MYKIKEIYYTLQGEGAHTGRPAVFCRFTGCNLWSGREEDRHKAICQFCDTDFWGTDGENGGRYTAIQLAELIDALWTGNAKNKYIVCTGGEPLLQLDTTLIKAFHAKGFEVGVDPKGNSLRFFLNISCGFLPSVPTRRCNSNPFLSRFSPSLFWDFHYL